MMGYNKAMPETWSTQQLLRYSTEHNLPVQRGMELKELVEMVKRHMQESLSCDQARAALKPRDENIADLLNTSPAEILSHVAHNSYAEILRKHPDKLKEIIEAGIQQLTSPEDVRKFYDAGYQPPVVAWFTCVIKGTDEGAAIQEALAAPITAAVCGRYFKSNEIIVHCEDCAVDATCVMCMDCFLHSPCRSHNYKLHPGSSGGMCDCGDAAAWKTNNFCSKHHGFQEGDAVTSWSEAQYEQWLGIVLRYLVQLIATALQQSMVLETNVVVAGALEQGYHLSTSTETIEDQEHETEGTEPDTASSSDDFSRIEEEEGTHTSGVFQWMWSWLGPLVTQLEDFGYKDWTKRLLSLGWAAPTVIPSHHLSAAAADNRNASCLEIVFLYQLNAKVVHQKSAGWTLLIKSIANCLSDPTFRIPFAALFMTYAERIQCKRSALKELYVQLFSCPATISALTDSPEGLPYAQPHFDSIIHRQLSSIVYNFCQLPRCPNSESKRRWMGVECPPWVIFVNERSSRIQTSTFTVLFHVLFQNDDLGLVAVLSRTFMRAWLHLLLLLSINTVIQKDPQSFTDAEPTSEFMSFHFNRSIYVMESKIKAILLKVQPTQQVLTGIAANEETAPVLSSAVQRLVGASRRFDPTPDRNVQCKSHRCILRQATLKDDESSSLLPALPSSPSEAPAAALNYILTLLREVKAALDIFLIFQRAYFCRGNTNIVLQRETCPILEYDLLKHAGNMMTLILPVQRWMALIIRVWLTHQQGLDLQEDTTYSGAMLVARRLHGHDNQEGEKPLHTLMNMLLSSTEELSPSACPPSLDFLEGLLDSLVMPFVLTAQKEEALWRRNDYNVTLRTLKYFELDVNITLLHDIYLIQILAICLPPPDLSIRLLQRFSYSRPRSDLWQGQQNEEAPPVGDAVVLGVGGLAGFLRLMLTLITDTGKSNCVNKDLTQVLRRLVATHLAEGCVTHSKLMNFIDITLFGCCMEDTGCMMERLSGILNEIAVAEDEPTGKVFRIKDLRTWERWVDLYHPMWRDASLPAVISQYRRIATLEKANDNNSSWNEEESREHRKDQTAKHASHRVMVPPTLLRTNKQYAEFVPSLRALLHTDGLILPACYVIQLYMYNVRCNADAVPKASKQNRQDDSDDDAGAYDVSEHLLLHAITALYLCVLDCAEVSRAIRIEAGVDECPDDAVTEGGPAKSPCDRRNPDLSAQSNSDGILWDCVEAYFEQSTAASPSFAPESVDRYVRLPELKGGRSIRAKLMKTVPPRRLCRPSFLSNADKTGNGITTADALHELRNYLRENQQLDDFSLLPMVEHVLLATGLARFQSSGGEAQGSAEDQVKSRQQRVKERQAKLLQRLQTRSSKACAQVESSGKAPVAEAEAPSPILAQTPVNSGYLHSKLLFELATVECCVCRLTHNEPLMLLGHCSTSGVLHHLRSVVLPDRRQLHSHYYICGHAAHKSCTNRIFQRLAQLWQRGYFQGQNFLGAAEFSCPICLMVCTNLSPLPTFSGPVKEGMEDELTLFEDIQRSTFSLNEPVVLSAVGDLHTSLAQAAIGTATSMDVKPIETYEDPLQEKQNDAWVISETLRAVYYSFRITLEAIKAGVHELNQKDLLSFLSLLISIPPQSLQRHEGALRANYHRTACDDFCLLMLDVLRAPKEASLRIQQHVAERLAAFPQAQEILGALVREGATPGLSEAAEDMSQAEPRPDLFALWAELGAVVLLKVLVCDEPVEAVLTVREGNPYFIAALHTESLGDAAQQAEAVLRMWGYLSRVALDRDGGVIPTVIARLAAEMVGTANATVPVRFANPGQWREHLLDKVLHLPVDYIDAIVQHNHILRECGDENERRNAMLCCVCGNFLFIELRGRIHELYTHARECVGGVGIFLILQYSSLLILDAVAGRLVEFSPIYTDKFGETDRGLRRGVRLTRNAAFCKQFLKLWIRNEWSVNSFILRNCRHIGGAMSYGVN